MLDFEHSQSIAISVDYTQAILRQPHVYMRPRVFADGNKWCALYGDDIATGVCAFADTPKKAAEAWDLVWLNGDVKTIEQR